MKTAGIISEYNPFHNGHAYHIAQTKQNCDVDAIICVMSGNFSQRGIPTIFDKWTRAKMAVAGGADVVLELPFLYAVQSAEGFANGGVRILDALGIVDVLSFGSECADLCMLNTIADTLIAENAAFSQVLKNQLHSGLSFAAARHIALQSICGIDDSDVFSSPNNILAIEYLKALKATDMKPYTLKRIGSHYHDEHLHTEFSSASAIRHSIAQDSFEPHKHIPLDCLSYLDADMPVDRKFFELILFRLRTLSIAELSEIADVTEGLEYKIKEASKTASDYNDLLLKIKSKRYAQTRISRILLYCLFGITKTDLLLANTVYTPYARVLAIKKDKIDLLSRISEFSRIPLITKPLNFAENTLLDWDIRATDIYSLLYKKSALSGRDFTQKLLVL
ncbi:MAG: nucleotidyltransferase [Christensenellaceae bacterium]